MEHIMEQYGRAILTGIIVVILLTVLFFTVKESEGNEGVLNIIGSHVRTEGTDYASYRDFDNMKEEGQKSKPVIESVFTAPAVVNREYDLSELIKASDYNGADLPLIVDKITARDGTETGYSFDAGTGKITFQEKGSYECTVKAIDDGKRSTVATIEIPVNKR